MSKIVQRQGERDWKGVFFVVLLVAAMTALAATIANAGEATLVYDWDVLEDLPRKEFKAAVADINARYFDMGGVEMVSPAEADPVLIVGGKPYHGRTTHFAGVEIPNVLSQRQHIGKWTWGEYLLAVLEAGAGYGVYYAIDKNAGGGGGGVREPTTFVEESKRGTVTAEGFDFCKTVTEDNESGSGKRTTECGRRAQGK